MKSALKIKLFSLAVLVSASQVDAANWLTLQGSQPEVVAPKGVKVPYRARTPKLWGFIQANYRKDFGTIQHTGTGKNQTPFSLLNPDLQDQSGFNIFRARLALRGMADKENKVNYFFMTEFGNSGINNLGGTRTLATYFSDASVTLKHIPYAKVRVGKFKFPGSEEGLQAVFVSPYISFTNMSNQQLLERHIDKVGAVQKGAAAGGAQTDHYTSSALTQPIGAFRDTGVQVFDTVNVHNGWDLSYAYMFGNGSGISNSNSGKQSTHYGYLALEDTYGGRGYFTKAMKFFVWGQSGSRTLLSNDGTSTTEVVNDRKRYGAGMTYYNHGLRFEVEYMKAQGMIFTGPKDQAEDVLVNDWQFQYAAGIANEADGGYINLQYEIIPKKFEVFGRYDVMHRLTNDAKGQRDFTTATLGASYRFKGPTRIDLNYAIRDINAPENANAQKVVDNVGNRLEIQVTAAF